MRRIAVIGNLGAGKSTLSRRLARELKLPYHELDALVFGPGWSLTPADFYETEHKRLMAGEEWILDGFGLPQSMATRLARATCIVLIDLPIWRNYLFAMRRHFEWVNGKLTYPPAGITEIPPLEIIFEKIWQVDQRMPKVRTLVEGLEGQGKTVVRLNSPEDVANFRPTVR